MTVATGTDRPQMADDDANDSQALTGCDIIDTEHLSHESVICHKIDQISCSHQCRYVARWQSQQCVTWSVSRGLEDISREDREQNAASAGSRVVSWRRIRMGR